MFLITCASVQILADVYRLPRTAIHTNPISPTNRSMQLPSKATSKQQLIASHDTLNNPTSSALYGRAMEFKGNGRRKEEQWSKRGQMGDKPIPLWPSVGVLRRSFSAFGISSHVMQELVPSCPRKRGKTYEWPWYEHMMLDSYFNGILGMVAKVVE